MSLLSRSPEPFLPIHPYFRKPRPEKNVSLEELSRRLFETTGSPAGV